VEGYFDCRKGGKKKNQKKNDGEAWRILERGQLQRILAARNMKIRGGGSLPGSRQKKLSLNKKKRGEKGTLSADKGHYQKRYLRKGSMGYQALLEKGNYKKGKEADLNVKKLRTRMKKINRHGNAKRRQMACEGNSEKDTAP